MKALFRNMVIALACTSMMTSCAMWNNETNGAVLGGLGGALLGGALGEVVGGYHGSHVGSTIGAVIGTQAGAAAGREQDRREAYEYYYGNSGSSTPSRNNSYHSDYSENYQSQDSYYDEESGLTYVRINSDGDITFEPGSSKLGYSTTNSLNTIAKKLKKSSNDIYLYGSTDSREQNAKQLSKSRANAVANYLISKGVSQRRIHIVALGNDNPIRNNNTERGRQLNRSVEVFIVK